MIECSDCGGPGAPMMVGHHANPHECIGTLRAQLAAAEQEAARLRAALEKIARERCSDPCERRTQARAALLDMDDDYQLPVDRAWAERKGTGR